MKFEDEQKRRALNLIWNVAEDYTIEPDIKVYDEKGDAQLYWNCIIGAVYKHFDMEQLNHFRESFEGLPRQELYESLYWIGLEQAAYHRELPDRPAFLRLRQDYVRQLLTRGRMLEESSQEGERLEWAHFTRLSGENPQMSDRDQNVLEALETADVQDTQQFIDNMREILEKYYGYDVDAKDRAIKDDWVKAIRNWLEKGRPKNELPPVRRFSFGYGEYIKVGDELQEHEKKRQAFHLPVLSIQTEEGLRQYIQDYFGTPLYTSEKTAELEKKYCHGAHKYCHLHFTKGGYDSEKLSQGYAGMRKRSALEQIAINKKYYGEHQDTEYHAILRLTNRIRNSLLAKLDSYTINANNGKIASERIWRGLYLEDNKVFDKERRGSEGSLSVDVLLDASVSQLHRQEIVAAQGYILAESLTRCQIPVRVCSFCSMSGYTIINQFRDYHETGKNQNLFNYFTSGCNRDGLAIRIAAGMLEDSPYDYKLLIVLSDVKPNDVLKINVERNVYHDYADDAAVDDVAREVHRARLNGISVVCVYTGKDEDLDNARRIYGRGLARIRSLNQFADTVGAVLQNEIDVVY